MLPWAVMGAFDDTRAKTQLKALHEKGEERLVQALAGQAGLAYINLHGTSINPSALARISQKDAREAQMVAFDEAEQQIAVALRHPQHPKVKEVRERLKSEGLDVITYLASAASIAHGIDRYKDLKKTAPQRQGVLDINPAEIAEFSNTITSHEAVVQHLQAIEHTDSKERVSHTIALLFGGALALGASDVHIEPEDETIRLRFRIDGVLVDITDIARTLYGTLNARLKLLSGVKLNVTSRAQDGRFTFQIGARTLEVRTSVIPGTYGESIVMRLLDPDAAAFTFHTLGLNKPLAALMETELRRPNGAIITTGPTGSGKTTALYAFLQEVHTPQVKIITIENPVEYKLPGIVQTQVDQTYTFEAGLRSVLRQDPDIIMIGEIRRHEVANITMQAALTGHLVFSTLHTNNAAAAFPRLLDLGVDARTIGNAVNVVLGQRLVRTLCKECKKERPATTQEATLVARITGEPVAALTVYDAVGCDACNGQGYRGRVGVFEGIAVDNAVEEAIMNDPREQTIRRAALPQGIPTMQQDGVQKVREGVTSLEELARVVDVYNTHLPEYQKENE